MTKQLNFLAKFSANLPGQSYLAALLTLGAILLNCITGVEGQLGGRGERSPSVLARGQPASWLHAVDSPLHTYTHTHIHTHTHTLTHYIH